MGGGEQHRVAPPRSRSAGRGWPGSGDLIAGQVPEHGPVEAFWPVSPAPRGDWQAGRVPDGGVAHARVNRRPAGVAGADAVAAFGFEVTEEVQQEFERVAVGLDGAGAGAALGDQPRQEKVRTTAET
jgi:hypothetical protein